MKGLLVYKNEDYKKNKSYAQLLIEYGKLLDLEIEVVHYEAIQMGVDEKGLWISSNHRSLEAIDFVINRTRESMLSKQLELMGIKVFNSYEVTHLANHKGRTHQFISSLGI
ncbi:MAG: hypothetical protein RR490_10220, partial [Niameybacter sp.]